MNDAWGDMAGEPRDSGTSAILDENWLPDPYREFERQQQEAERWQRRVALAERHKEFALATKAAQLARRHAGLALAAERLLAEQPAQRNRGTALFEAGAPASPASAPVAPRRNRPEPKDSIDIRLAAIKARQYAVSEMEG